MAEALRSPSASLTRHPAHFSAPKTSTILAIAPNKLFHHFLLEGSHRLSLLRISPSISLIYAQQNLPTLADADKTHANANSLSPNLFAEFATTKFNLSSANIARLLKYNPALERLKTLEKVEQFVDLFKRYGYTQYQILAIMKQSPLCVTLCPEKVIEPKLLLLRDLGIQGNDLVKVVARNPKILLSSLQNVLIPNAAFLQHVFKTHDLFIKAFLRQPSILTYDLEKQLKPSVVFFEECGLVGEPLSKFIASRPGLLHCSCLTPAKAEFFQKIGVNKGSKMYKYVLGLVLVSRLETLEAKIDNFQQCGLTAEETLELFRVYPFAFGLAEEKVQQKMDFIVNYMELPSNSVLKWRYLLKHNLKVFKPRFIIFKRIQNLNNLGQPDIRGLASILAMSEEKFVNKIIEGHPESKLLNGIYQEALTNASANAKADTKKKNISKRWCF